MPKFQLVHLSNMTNFFFGYVISSKKGGLSAVEFYFFCIKCMNSMVLAIIKIFINFLLKITILSQLPQELGVWLLGKQADLCAGQLLTSSNL